MENLKLQLGHAELVYLLWLMRTFSIPGLGNTPFEDVSKEQVIASLMAAEQALQSRDLIALKDGNTSIDRQVLLLVGSCALAKNSVVINSQINQGDSITRYYHYHTKAWVCHTIHENGVHSFELIDSPLEEVVSIIGVLVNESADLKPLEITIPRRLLEQVFLRLTHNPVANGDETLHLGLPIAQQELLFEILSTIQGKVFVGTSYNNRADNFGCDSLVLIRSDRGFWELQSSGDSEYITLLPRSGRDIYDRLYQLLETNEHDG